MDIKISALPLASSISGTEYVPIVQGGITKKTLASTLTGGGGGGGISLTDLSATTPLLYDNLTGIFSIQVANTSQNGYLSSTDWNTFNGKQDSLVSGTNIKTVNGTTLLGSGNLQLGDVLIGGNTTGADITIGNNSNFNLSLRTNNIIRQTIANDGLVTFNGTTGNAGRLQIRRVDILDFDGVTWKSALDSNVTTDTLNLAIGFSSVSVSAAVTITGNTTVNGNLNANVIRNRSNGTNLQLYTQDRSGASTDNIYLKSGDNSVSGAFVSGSVLLDVGTTTGAGLRGGVAFFNGNTSPSWQSGERIVFIGNRTTTPTGDPAGGYFNWSESGVPKFRTSTGNVIILEKQTAVTTAQGIADALTAVGLLATSTIIGGGGSGITRSVNVVSTSGTLGSTALTDYVYKVTATSTQTLPTAVGNTNRYTIKATGGTVTIDTTSGQTIDGASTMVLNGSLNTSTDLISDGANWLIIV